MMEEFDFKIYSKETLARLEESGLTIEDVHSLSEAKSVFSRKILAMFSENEKPGIRLIQGVENEERSWLEERKERFNHRDFVSTEVKSFWKKFLGDDLSRWKALTLIFSTLKYSSSGTEICDDLYKFKSVFEKSPDLFFELSNLSQYPFCGDSASRLFNNLKKIKDDDILERILRLICNAFRKFDEIKSQNNGAWNPEPFIIYTLLNTHMESGKFDSKAFDDLIENKKILDTKIDFSLGKYPSEEQISILAYVSGSKEITKEEVFEFLSTLNTNGTKILLLFKKLIIESPSCLPNLVAEIHDLPIAELHSIDNHVNFTSYCIENEISFNKTMEFLSNNDRIFAFGEVLRYVKPKEDAENFLDFLDSHLQNPNFFNFLQHFLSANHDVVHNDVNIFFKVVNFWERNSEKYPNFIELHWGFIGNLKHLYKDDVDKLDDVIKPMVLDIKKSENLFFLLADRDFCKIVIDDVSKIQNLMDVMGALPVESIKSISQVLTQATEMFGSDMAKLQEVIDLFLKVKNKYSGFTLDQYSKCLNELKDVHKNDLAKMEIIAKYLDEVEIIDLKTVAVFIDKYQKESPEAANKYIESLNEKSKGLIVEGLPEHLRKDPEYMFYVKRIYPSGNYSNHEKNLACGDKLEHLKGYKFETEGYATEMTGLKGYKVSEGKAENGELLGSYKERLTKIRSFVASRGPDNVALREAFEKKIDDIFEKNVKEEFKIQKLTLKEKLLILALNIVIKRSKQEPYEYDISDLIVEYKYAFHENLEAYIQRTADETARFKDPVSQNFNLWRELSVIYGENLKHVLRHDLFEEFEKDSENKDEISNVYDSLMQGKEKFELDSKQKERFNATFDNSRIPPEKKTDALKSQAVSIFSSNIKFKNEEEKLKFIEDVKNLVDGCEMNREKFFAEAIPKLFRLRQRALQDLNGKLENMFNSDINLISAEISKYEEILEVEMKQTRMGGEKHKEVEKSAKKRKIRGYITKTKETANARMGAYLCIAGNGQMWENPNYFELVMKDEETGKCVGLCMMLNINAKDGKKYLWFGPNPFEGFLGQVSSEQCYKYMYETVTKFATENGYDGVVIPPEDGQILGACTNRGGDFPDLIKSSRLRNEKGDLKIVEFGEKHTLGGSYGYSSGALIWAK